MTITVFIVDTSASMAQKTYKGNSYLDMCKSFVTEYIKMRGRDLAVKGFDRYMLLTTEEFPQCIKEIRTQWRETALMEQMKILRPKGRSSLANAIMNAFRVINTHRHMTGIENYGLGRYPFFMEPYAIITLSDGLSADEIPSDFKMELRGQLTKEAYRWDERLYSVVLRIPALAQTFSNGRLEFDKEPIERLCAATGGRSYCVQNHRQIQMVIENLCALNQNVGVLVRFWASALEKLAPTSNLNGLAESQPELRLKRGLELRPLTNVIVKVVGGKAAVNHWPIPEAFSNTRLESHGMIPQRTCHPTIEFNMDFKQSQIVTDFPFDKYELEPSPIVDYVIEKTKMGNQEHCSLVFMKESDRKPGVGKPFGYLKITSVGTGVNLFIMPYNFPALFTLLTDLKTDPNIRNNAHWKKRLDNYLESVPPYYIAPLRKHLAKFKISSPLLDDPNFPPPVYPTPTNMAISRLKPQGKDEYDRLTGQVNAMAQQLQIAPTIPSLVVTMERRPRLTPRKDFRTEMDAVKAQQRKDRRRDPRDRREPTPVEESRFTDPADTLINPEKMVEKTNIPIVVSESRIRNGHSSAFRNPLILRKNQVVSELLRMKANLEMLIRDTPVPALDGGRPGFNMRLHHSDDLHSLPIAQMGNYEEYIKALAATGGAPLREIEEKAVRTHAFGNPFKTDKKNMAVDEVGEGDPSTSNPSTSRNQPGERPKKGINAGKRPPKRKAGPLAFNTMANWRERRRTLSTTSSTVSDMSYMSDLDSEAGTSTPDESIGRETSPPPLVNGKANGSASKDITPADWGMEEEQEDSDAEEPPAKKALLAAKKSAEASSAAPPVLNSVDMRKKKIDIAWILRRNQHDTSAFNEIRSAVQKYAVSDSLELVEYCCRDSLRYKRKALTTSLNEEKSRLRELVAKNKKVS